MKRILLMVVILVLGFSAQSRAQNLMWGLDPKGNSIIYVCPSIYLGGEEWATVSYTILKLNANGTEVWRTEYQGVCWGGEDLKIDPKGDILIPFDVEKKLKKFSNKTGALLWQTDWSYDDEIIFRFDSSGNIFTYYYQDGPVQKYNGKTGALLWTWTGD